MRLMVLAMLADRFHLQIHSEFRREQTYKLEIAKGGIRLIASKSTMTRLARTLAPLTNQTVTDQTGLNGFYDFDVRWSGPEVLAGKAPENQFGGPELAGSLISNLQRQFGLRLTSAMAPVTYWVVDHVDPPDGELNLSFPARAAAV